MKRKVLSAIGIILLTLTIYSNRTLADTNPYGEPVLIEATAYCDTGITADGSQVREGIAAGRKEWLGKVAIVYTVREQDGMPEFYGFYEIKDTGADKRIKTGECLDLWMPTEAECKEWGRRKIFVQIVDGKG